MVQTRVGDEQSAIHPTDPDHDLSELMRYATRRSRVNIWVVSLSIRDGYTLCWGPVGILERFTGHGMLT